MPVKSILFVYSGLFLTFLYQIIVHLMFHNPYPFSEMKLIKKDPQQNNLDVWILMKKGNALNYAFSEQKKTTREKTTL